MATEPRSYDMCVIGGGPAGLMSAGRAAELGERVVLLEKNRVTGRKLLLTGGGRCNVTAGEDPHQLVARYGRRGGALRGVFSRFSPADMRAFLARHGVQTVVEAGNRVFPATQRASAVHEALLRYADAGGVQVRTGARVVDLAVDDRKPHRFIRAAILADGSQVTASRFVLATGGTSRPETGSTGDGLRWLAELGARVRRSEPALVPIRVGEAWALTLQGLSMPRVRLSALLDGRRQAHAVGELLFTHFGLSGPLVLGLSQELNELAQGGPVDLSIDLFPDEDTGSLDRRLQRVLAEAPRRKLPNAIAVLVPQRLARVLLSLAGIDGERPASVTTRADRQRLVATAKALRLTFAGLLGSDRAVVSSGGVDPAEIDFAAMRLRSLPNLAVVGDLLDFDRQSGGYSLQLCWASGWAAGGATGSPPVSPPQAQIDSG